MLASSMTAAFEPVRYLDHNVIVAGYTGIQTETVYPFRLFTIKNWTDVDLMFSLDGVHDHIPVAANSEEVYDVASNTFITSASGMLAFPAGTRFYVKRIAGAEPNDKGVYVQVLYGSEQL
jgi:hypothetical protein